MNTNKTLIELYILLFHNISDVWKQNSLAADAVFLIFVLIQTYMYSLFYSLIQNRDQILAPPWIVSSTSELRYLRLAFYYFQIRAPTQSTVAQKWIYPFYFRYKKRRNPKLSLGIWTFATLFIHVQNVIFKTFRYLSGSAFKSIQRIVHSWHFQHFPRH